MLIQLLPTGRPLEMEEKVATAGSWATMGCTKYWRPLY